MCFGLMQIFDDVRGGVILALEPLLGFAVGHPYKFSEEE